MTWDAAKTEMLRVLHATEASFSQIAHSINRAFGTNFSRNAAIGKARRLGLDKRINPGNINAHPKSETPRVRKYTPRKMTFEPSQIPTVFAVTLMDLEPWMCRYPEGDGPMFFCGHPAADGSAYCSLHHEVCHVQPHYHRNRTQDPLPRNPFSPH